jgi:hypothetical protein
MYFNLENCRRLELSSIDGIVVLAEMDRRTFEWESLCEFTPIKTHGDWYFLRRALGLTVTTPEE